MSVVELAACQVYVTADDYADQGSFAAMLARVGHKLDAQRARRSDGSFAYECLAVFPEMIGAFLPLVGKRKAVRHASTVDGVMARIALQSLPMLGSAMLRGRTLSPKIGFLLATAKQVRQLYVRVFQRFAVEHQAWVIAGTALLPRNANGDLAADFEPLDARVYNTSYAFAPDGRLVGTVRKVNLVPTLEDTLGLSNGTPRELHPIDTPFGRVGTMICYDGFYIPHTNTEPGFCRLASHYDTLGCSILAQPSANPWPWRQPWVFAERGETQLRDEQWLTEGLFAQLRDLPLSKIRYAVTPHLLGDVLDTHFEGCSHILAREPEGVRIVAEASRFDAVKDAEQVVLKAVTLDGG